MTESIDTLGNFELAVLLGLMRRGSGIGMRILEVLQEKGVPASIGAVYTTLARLERKKLVESRRPSSRPAHRGQPPRRSFRMTPRGIRAVQVSYRNLLAMGEGIECLVP